MTAAASLLSEANGTRFAVDQLAERADVSRRTIFNHFASLEDIVVAVCSDVLDTLVDTFLAVADHATGADDSLFDQLTETLRRTDLVPPMAYLTRALGGPAGEWTPQQEVMLGRAFTAVSARLSDEMASRHPDVDPLDIHLLVGALMSGVTVLYRHWFDATGAAESEQSRRLWAGLVDRLVATFRAGYGPTTDPAP